MDLRHIRKEEVAHSKISGYVWTGPEASSARIRIFVKVHIFYTNRPSIHTKPVNPLCRVFFLSLVCTDPDLKMCGLKNYFKINRRSMYEKMHSLKKTDDFCVKQIIFTEY